MLSNEEIAKVFALYFKAETISPKYPKAKLLHGLTKWFDASKYGKTNPELWKDRRLLLTPLKDISTIQVLEVCKVFSPELYGDYRFNKWYVEVDGKNGKHQQVFYVKRENSDRHYYIDLLTGEILIYGEEGFDVYATKHNYYFQYFYDNSIDVPLYFGNENDGKTAIELGIAIDKNKTLK